MIMVRWRRRAEVGGPKRSKKTVWMRGVRRAFPEGTGAVEVVDACGRVFYVN